MMTSTNWFVSAVGFTLIVVGIIGHILAYIDEKKEG